METLPSDLLNNLASLTEQLKSYQNRGPPEVSSIDLAGIDDDYFSPPEQVSRLLPAPIKAPSRDMNPLVVQYNQNVQPKKESSGFGMNIESNVPGLEDRLLGSMASVDTVRETSRLLSLKKPQDDHTEFKLDVKELSKIDQLIDEYTQIISKLKKKKTELRQKTLKHMVRHKIDTAKISKKESYSVVTSKRKINPTTKVRLPQKIRDFFIKEEKMDDHKAEALASRIVKWIHENAEYQLSKILRHQKPKKENQ